MDHPQTHRSYVSYIDRSRDYYAAQGYARPYAWAHHDDVPFAPLGNTLAACTVGLVTTAARTQRTDMIGPPLMFRELYAQPADPPPQRLFTEDLFWDKKATHTDDVDSFLPINRLAELAAAGRIRSASPRFYGVPTDYSQTRTREQAAPRILEWCREDRVDAVLLAGL
jgi:D-proline reductase (dithiol) PrdB